MNATFEMSELARKLENLIRLGKVIEVDASTSRVTVKMGNLTTRPLPWLETAAGETRTRRVPSVGEQVVVLSMSGELNNGVVLGGLSQHRYPSLTSPPEEEQHVFSDGTTIRYNSQHHALNITVQGTVTLKASSLAIEGDVDIKGSVHVSGNLLADGLNSNHHTH